MKSKIAIVILNWNGRDLLEKFLPKIVKYSPQATIYVADNASTDDSIKLINAQFPEVKLIINQSNYGFAKGYNEALKLVDEEILALINSDIEVTENWLNPILTMFDNEPNTAIIQPKILDYKNKEYFEYAGAAGGFIDKYGYPFCRGRIFDTIEKDNQQYNDSIEIFWASGASFFVRSNVYKELNGFDDDFFAHQEEIDLCWRARNKGYIAKYNPHAVVYHIGGATLQESNPKKTFLNFRNSLLMLIKNLPKKSLLKIIFLRLCLDGIAGLRLISQGKFSHCLAIIKAHFSFYKLLLKTYKKRNHKQIDDYYKINSIVYTYYTKNGKLFDKIFLTQN